MSIYWQDREENQRYDEEREYDPFREIYADNNILM